MIVVDQFARAEPPDQRCASLEAKAQLQGSDWKLIELAGTPVVTEPGAKQANLVLSWDGKTLAGSTGCNQMFGTYELQKDTLRFKPLGMTMMACLDPLMKQEQMLIDAIKVTSSYRLGDRTLEFCDGERVLARFESKAR